MIFVPRIVPRRDSIPIHFYSSFVCYKAKFSSYEIVFLIVEIIYLEGIRELKLINYKNIYRLNARFHRRES